MRKLIISLITAAAIAATAGPALAAPPDPCHALVRVAAVKVVPGPGGCDSCHRV